MKKKLYLVIVAIVVLIAAGVAYVSLGESNQTVETGQDIQSSK